MESIEKIKAHYGFTAHDAENLRKLRPVMEKHVEEFPKELFHIRACGVVSDKLYQEVQLRP